MFKELLGMGPSRQSQTPFSGIEPGGMRHPPPASAIGDAIQPPPASVLAPRGNPTMIPAEGRALLNAIAPFESGGAYNVRYSPQGPKTFDDFTFHPRVYEKRPDGRMASAAGRYQILASTWDRLGGGEFTPEMQDARAWQLAQMDFKARTGQDLLQTLKAEGISARVHRTLVPTWEGWAGKELGTIQDIYTNSLAEGAPLGAVANGLGMQGYAAEAAPQPAGAGPAAPTQPKANVAQPPQQRRAAQRPYIPQAQAPELPEAVSGRGAQPGIQIAQGAMQGIRHRPRLRGQSRTAGVTGLADYASAVRGGPSV